MVATESQAIAGLALSDNTSLGPSSHDVEMVPPSVESENTSGENTMSLPEPTQGNQSCSYVCMYVHT